MLKIKNLKKHFGGIKAVDDANFTVKKGTITALIGPNGAGKSTVFNLVSGVLRPDEGEILFKDNEITNLKIEEISNLGISRLFQTSKLFQNLTVQENLLLAFDDKDTKFWINLFGFNKTIKEKTEKIKEILEIIEMKDFLNRQTRALSFGQQRLVEIGRAIINPHSLLMLDEPVAGVNPKLRNIISKTISKLREEGETILLIEHDMEFTLEVADRVIVMEKGRVIAEGSPEEIKNNQKVLSAYLGE
ncbi:MAG: ABC transporter ATP-binding protein [Candidatus Paceibacterota bacterium]